MKPYVLALILSSAGSVPCSADEEAAIRVRKLVEMLASKNEERPTTRDGKFPPKYDRNSQAVVYLAMQGLFQDTEVAYDELLRHTADERYSYSYESPSRGCQHFTVGDVCIRMAHRFVYCYEDRMLHNITSDLPGKNPFDMRFNSAWRKKHFDMPLYELQVEAVNLQIEFMKNLDHETASPRHPSAEKLPREEFEQKRKENLATLEALKASILANKQPYRPKSIDTPYESMMGLPWPNRGFGLE